MRVRSFFWCAPGTKSSAEIIAEKNGDNTDTTDTDTETSENV